MKKIGKLGKIVLLLEEIYKFNRICIEETAERLEISRRTLQRYLNELEIYFKLEKYRAGRGCYRYNLKNWLFKVLKQGEGYGLEELLILLAQLNPKFARRMGIDLNALKKSRRDPRVFLIKNIPLEQFPNWDFMRIIQRAIKHYQKLRIEYILDVDGKEVVFHILKFKPYRIVIWEGNWYLVGEEEGSEIGVKRLRIAFIQKIVLLQEEFRYNREIKKFIEESQSLFSKFQAEEQEAVVWVDPKVIRYFKQKKFLKSQEIVGEWDKGLLITYKWTSPMEIIRLVKSWFPYMVVISPVELRRELEEIAEQFLERSHIFAKTPITILKEMKKQE